ncbi:hypothetical protein CEQ51_27510 [Pseudomonas thivervalensis]|uniref:Uncharacterized protein n=1 Tax=Pseudomonas thivervalensis TaxID=86265 RepID=A0A2Z4ZKS2_9PSED|nr:hypothetical protein CE140_27515 [Pseudomonas thivervalensis]AXA63663.1 hypothetical protein CEQ51_27510 [Pseudomonas thivervalensis]
MLKKPAVAAGFFMGRRKSRTACQPCGSELALDSGGSAGIDVGCAAVIASKLAPTGGCAWRGTSVHSSARVGASLLAMAFAQATQFRWRGSLLPLGCAAVAKPGNTVSLEECRGLLRRPAGASSLATNRIEAQVEGGW